MAKKKVVYVGTDKAHWFLAPGAVRWDNAVAVGDNGVTYLDPVWGEVTAIGATLQDKPKDK